MAKAKSTFEIESLLVGVKKPTFQDLVNKHVNYAEKYKEDQLKNKEEVIESISSNESVELINPELAVKSKDVSEMKPKANIKNFEKNSSIAELNRLFTEIKNNKSDKYIFGENKTQQIRIGNNLKFQIEELIFQVNRSSQNSGDTAKKITVRDFLDLAVINFLKKFNL